LRLRFFVLLSFDGRLDLIVRGGLSRWCWRRVPVLGWFRRVDLDLRALAESVAGTRLLPAHGVATCVG
jgi:hypothetical protein